MVDRRLILVHELSEQDRAALDRAIFVLRADWQRAPPEPRLDCYLPPSDQRAYPRLLVELIKEDLECRRQPGRVPKTPSQYVEECPTLQGLAGVDGELSLAADAPSTRAWSGLSGSDGGAGPMSVERPAAPLLPAGHRLGHYRILRLLGSGGMGNVYLAEDEELQRQVAVKVPYRHLFRSEEDLTSTLSEARTVARLKHAAIVPVYYLGREPDGTCYIVMEYIDGPSLAERLNAGPLEPRQAAQWMAQIADAIGYVHRRGFVHRDLKPQNILLDKEERLHVADFGLALHTSAQQQMAGDRSGTLRYMAPEQVRGEAQWLDGRADVWALGAIFYEMLTGEPPFVAKDPEDLAREIQGRPPRPPRQHAPSLPPELERICLQCLAKEAGRRYATATDLVGDLRRWLHPRAGRRAVVASLLAVVVLILAAVVWRLRKEPPPPPLAGSINILVWNDDDPSRRGLPINDPRALPLRPKDAIRVEAQLDQPAYVYLLWIGSDGRVSPLYPWKPGQWMARAAKEMPVTRVSLPERADNGWPVEGPGGMETLVLLARREPMPAGLDLAAKLARLPRQPMLDSRALAWFDNGRLVTRQTDPVRGLGLDKERQIHDTILQTQRLIKERLGPHFSLIRSVSVASKGNEMP